MPVNYRKQMMMSAPAGSVIISWVWAGGLKEVTNGIDPGIWDARKGEEEGLAASFDPRADMDISGKAVCKKDLFFSAVGRGCPFRGRAARISRKQGENVLSSHSSVGFPSRRGSISWLRPYGGCFLPESLTSM